ncbi:MAG: hypothetical protein HYV97_07630 [Bdellovibrio sp.]|nr:hypothetical protein [Bdellovibrio sp.]
MKTTMKILALATFTATSALAADGKLGCDNVLDLNDYKGQTYLNFMQETVKPMMDQYATKGYQLKGAAEVKSALRNVSSKVKNKAIESVGGDVNALYRLAGEIEGETVTLYDLPNLIGEHAPRGADRFTLSTFFGLVSCGGVVIQYAPENLAYNIHYGTGENKMDERTGRSFGEGPVRSADDASDKNYLQDLEEFVLKYEDSMQSFYRTLIKALANSDTSDFSKIAPFGQTLLTDFLAVYTAEQARNLMDGRISLHWDAALLEVTLLAAFHAGQDEITLFYNDPTQNNELVFTNSVYNQAPGCEGSVRGKERSARLYDYWQFSRNPDPSNCRRSGINLTKDAFRTLGETITEFEREKHPELVERLENHFGVESTKNIFKSLSQFFISADAKSKVGTRESNELAEDVAAFLLQVKRDARTITRSI